MLTVVAANHEAGPIRVRAVEAVEAALRELGYRVVVLEADLGFAEAARRLSPDLVFNLCSGVHSREDQVRFAALLEMCGVWFTGAGSLGHAVGLDKPLTKLVCRAAGIPTPRFALVGCDGTVVLGEVDTLAFPVLVKPARAGSSAGIDHLSLATTEVELHRAINRCLELFAQPALVEEFVLGREFTVAVLEDGGPRALPPEEILFVRPGEEARSDGGWGFYSEEVKERDEVRTVCPALISAGLSRALADLAERAFRAVGCRDLARVDFRVPAGVEAGTARAGLGTAGAGAGTARAGQGRAEGPEGPFLLEVNTLPGLTPAYSELPRIAQAAGLSYRDLIARIVESAEERRRKKDGTGCIRSARCGERG